MLVWYLEGCGVAVNAAGSVAAGGISGSFTMAVFKELENCGDWKPGSQQVWLLVLQRCP